MQIFWYTIEQFYVVDRKEATFALILALIPAVVVARVGDDEDGASLQSQLALVACFECKECSGELQLTQ